MYYFVYYLEPAILNIGIEQSRRYPSVLKYLKSAYHVFLLLEVAKIPLLSLSLSLVFLLPLQLDVLDYLDDRSHGGWPFQLLISVTMKGFWYKPEDDSDPRNATTYDLGRKCTSFVESENSKFKFVRTFVFFLMT